MMVMQWKDHWSVSGLFDRRKQLVEDLYKIENGFGECSIHGHYKRKELSEAHKVRLDELLRDHVTTEIAHVDAELSKLGVSVTDEES